MIIIIINFILVLSALSLIGDTFQTRIGIWKCWSLRRRENWSTGEKTRRKPTTKSTYIWCWVRESNPGHIGGRQAVSPLRHPCSDILNKMIP